VSRSLLAFELSVVLLKLVTHDNNYEREGQ
jgi:hypothetical protein